LKGIKMILYLSLLTNNEIGYALCLDYVLIASSSLLA